MSANRASTDFVGAGWDTSAETKFRSLNLFSILYPQTEKNEIEISLK